jgi:hypothetical protein
MARFRFEKSHGSFHRRLGSKVSSGSMEGLIRFGFRFGLLLFGLLQLKAKVLAMVFLHSSSSRRSRSTKKKEI